MNMTVTHLVLTVVSSPGVVADALAFEQPEEDEGVVSPCHAECRRRQYQSP